VIAALVGTGIGVALAQDRAPGQLDVTCASNCTAHGYDEEFCGQVCWIPDPEMVAKGEGIDWKCTTACRDRGGKLSDCLPRCQRR
jgi:hypothetical protein